MFQPLCASHHGYKTFFEKTLWGGSLWDVKLVRHVSDRLNLFDVSKCGGIVGNMSLLNEACSSQFHTAQSVPDTSVSPPKYQEDHFEQF